MDFQPMSGRQFPRFSAIKTFFRLPTAELSENFDIALFGTPFDGGVSYRPGARFAPSAVREASSLGRGFHWSRGLSLFQSQRIADIGDCPTVPIDLAQTYQQIEGFVTQVIASGKRFVSCGGDHSTTLPVLRALRKHHGCPLAFIHFDAHLDTYPAAWGCEYHHGSFVRHAIEEGLIDPAKTLHLGLRGPLAGTDDLLFVKKHGLRLMTVDDLRASPLDQVLRQLPAFDQTPTYLTFDIDCLDPAYAPGTGTPVPGGLTTFETQRLIRALKVPHLVGADVVEISPPFDQSQITALAGVDAMFEILCLMAQPAGAGSGKG